MATLAVSHARTAERSSGSPPRRLWSPGTTATLRPRRAGGTPNGSRAPWTTRTGARTASSSARRLFSGRPGGWSGNARQQTPTAPASAAVRQATRAPDERPPTRSGRRASSVRRGRAPTPRPRPGGGGAGGAGAGRAPPARERQARELGTAELRDDREPRRVELTGRSGPAPPGDAIRLLDERDGEAEGDGLLRRSDQVARADPAARAVAEHERRPRLRYGAHVHPREPRRCLDLDRAHRLIVPDAPVRPRADYPKGMMAFLLPPSRIRPSGGP